MIITVTMNPAIDKTAELTHFQHEALNRLNNVVTDAGGKGINVSKTIQALGGESIATGFLAGNGGTVICNVLESMHIQSDFIFVEGETRTNLKIVEPGGVLTELNEAGPCIDEAAIEQLLLKLEAYATKDTMYILSGSVSAGVDKSIYKRIIECVKKKGAAVFLDADGELFTNALEAAPNMIKPNKFELEQYFHCEHEASEEELIQMGQKLQAKGIQNVIISMGKDGALFLLGNRIFKAAGLQVKAHSTVGAGDAMVAAFSYGMHEKLNIEACIRLSVAASAGAVVTIGTKPPTKELVDKLKMQVEIIER